MNRWLYVAMVWAVAVACTLPGSFPAVGLAWAEEGAEPALEEEVQSDVTPEDEEKQSEDEGLVEGAGEATDAAQAADVAEPAIEVPSDDAGQPSDASSTDDAAQSEPEPQPAEPAAPAAETPAATAPADEAPADDATAPADDEPASDEEAKKVAPVTKLTSRSAANAGTVIPDTQPEGAERWTSNDGNFTGWFYNNLFVLDTYRGSATDVVVPETINIYWPPIHRDADMELDGICKTAFAGNTSITSVTINAPITGMSNGAFAYCTNLKSFACYGESLTRIPEECFIGCTALTQANIPSSVEGIGTRAFKDCTGITSIAFEEPSSLREIGEGSFQGCTSLQSVEIPRQVRRILKQAFKDCISLKSFSCDYPDDSELSFVNDEAFAGCTALIEAELSFATSWSDYDYSSLGKDAFKDCLSLQKIGFRHFPAPHGGSATCFNNCKSLSHVILYDENLGKNDLGLPERAVYMLVKIQGSGSSASLSINKIFFSATFTNAGPKGEIDLVIPKSFISYDFTSIADDATTIQKDLYVYAYALKSLSFEEGSKITSIGKAAFEHCSYMKSVTIPPSVTSIGEKAFYACLRLKDLKFQTTSLEALPTQVFYGCDELKRVELPEGMYSVGKQAFGHCLALEEVYFSDTIDEIDNDAFEDSDYIHLFHMPNSSNRIALGNRDFWRFSDITKVHFEVTAGSWFEANVLAKSSTLLNQTWYIPVSLTDNTVSMTMDAAERTYNAKAQVPAFTEEKRWFHTLVGNGEDYQIDESRSNCTDANNEATVTIVAVNHGEHKTKFSGERTFTFVIKPRDITNEDGVRTTWLGDPDECFWDNDSWQPERSKFRIRFNGLLDESPYNYTMTEDDVDLVYTNEDNNVDAGFGSVTLKGKGNFTGTKRIESAFPILARDLATEVTVDPIDDQKYTGKEVKPEVVAHVPDRNGDDIELSEDYDDFVVAYENNIEPGTATAKLTPGPAGNLTGKTDVTFKIEETPCALGIYTRSDVSPASVGDATVTPGWGPYEFGSTATVTAPVVDDYTLLGWYEVTEVKDGLVTGYGERLSTSATYTVTVKGDTRIVAVYHSDSIANVVINAGNGAKYRVSCDDTGATYDDTTTWQVPVGDTITATADDADQVLHWENESDKIIGRKGTLNITVTGSMRVLLRYRNKSNSESFVQFVDDYQKVLVGAQYKPTDDIYFPEGPSKFGYKFRYWRFEGEIEKVAQADIQAAIAAGEKVITLRPFYDQGNQVGTLIVKTQIGDNVTSTATTTNLPYGQTQTLNAYEERDGGKFKCWEDESGTVLGYDRTFRYNVSKPSYTLIARYVPYSEEVQAVPVINVTEYVALVSNDEPKLSSVITRSVPAGWTLVEHGLLYAKDLDASELDEATFIYTDGSNGISRYKSNDMARVGYLRGNFKVSQMTTSVSVRGFMVVKKNGSNKLETLYTDIVSGTYQSLS